MYSQAPGSSPPLAAAFDLGSGWRSHACPFPASDLQQGKKKRLLTLSAARSSHSRACLCSSVPFKQRATNVNDLHCIQGPSILAVRPSELHKQRATNVNDLHCIQGPSILAVRPSELHFLFSNLPSYILLCKVIE